MDRASPAPAPDCPRTTPGFQSSDAPPDAPRIPPAFPSAGSGCRLSSGLDQHRAQVCAGRGARDAEQFFTDVVGVVVDDLLPSFALFFLAPLGFALFADLFV